MPPTKFCLNLTYHARADEVYRFSRGHPRYRNRTILAILNLYVAPMPPIKFGLNPITVWEEMPLEQIWQF